MKLSVLYENKDILSGSMMYAAELAAEQIVDGLESGVIRLTKSIENIHYSGGPVYNKKGKSKTIDFFVVQAIDKFGGTTNVEPEDENFAQVLLKIPNNPYSWSTNEARKLLMQDMKHVISHELVHCFDPRFEQEHLYKNPEVLHPYVNIVPLMKELKKELKKTGEQGTTEWVQLIKSLGQLEASYARSVTEQDAYLASMASTILGNMFDQGLDKKQAKREISKFNFKKYLTNLSQRDWDKFKIHPRFRKMLGKALYSHLNRIY